MAILKIKDENGNFIGIPSIKGDKGEDGAIQYTAGENIEITADNVINCTASGSGGASDYVELTNKPKINNVELTGNKTLDELNIQPKGNYLTSIPSEYVTETELNSKGYITSYTETDPTVPSHVKNITEENITNWNNKSNYIPKVATVSIDSDVSMLTTDYYKTIAMNKITQVGDVFSLATTSNATISTTGVKVGAGVSKVLISGSAAFKSDNTNSEMYYAVYIHKDTTNIPIVARSVSSIAGLKDYCTLNITPIVLEVQEGDIFYMRTYKSLTAGVGEVLAYPRTYITIEALE